MKKKILKRYVYEGLGFPVVLKNVPTILIRGELTPDIDYNALQKAVLILLCYKRAPLTGNEVKFIRKYFEMNLTEFGAEFGCSHAAVMKWEKFGNRFAKIGPATDVCIRLFSIYRLHCKSSAFKELYDRIKIQELAKCQKKPSHFEPFAIDMSEDLEMAVNC